MKRILGLDIGTNSIGWALVTRDANNGHIDGIGSRIIPLSMDQQNNFDQGNKVSQTAERTSFRGIRRLRERQLLRRERLHRILHLLGYLPEHYAAEIDFDRRLGQFKNHAEPKLAYTRIGASHKCTFLFQQSFEEMLAEFRKTQPELVAGTKKVPRDWTIYYLRKKALTQKIDKHELAWLLLHFNQKRGYYQLRGEDEEWKENKLEEYYALKVLRVEAGEKGKNKEETWYNVHLENGMVYRRSSKIPLDWEGKIKEFIITTDLNEDGSPKLGKDGGIKRSFRAPGEDDWSLRKKKTEVDLERSGKQVGCYIFDTLLAKPDQKIIGGLIRVIERKYYRSELNEILRCQSAFHPELQNPELYAVCVQELYPHNDAHRNSIAERGFVHLFVEDIIFYQRPLKSKKSLISDCKFETRYYQHEGITKQQPLKGAARSHPLSQEFRLWQFVQNLKIYKKNKPEDIDVTQEFIKTNDDVVSIFDWLNDRETVGQKALLKWLIPKKSSDYRWNYVEEKDYPANETRGKMLTRLKKANIPESFLTKQVELELWHILYSVEDQGDIEKALYTFARRHQLSEEFVRVYAKFPSFEKQYAAYSEKALKKLLPLMRVGQYWDQTHIANNMRTYQTNIQQVAARIREKEGKVSDADKAHGKSANSKLLDQLEKLEGNVSDCAGVPHHIASYLVYGRHSETDDMQQWKTPQDLQRYIKEFKQHSLRNPIVEQVIVETLRVVKDIWQQYGQGQENFFDEIHVELGREMKNPANKRKELTEQVTKNENTNLRIKALMVELANDGEVDDVRPYSPSQQEALKLYEEGVLSAEKDNLPDDIVKIAKSAVPTDTELRRYRLWLDQKYRSPYTGNMIPLSRLFTTDYQVDHIIPQARYFDDSLSNKVICEAAVNGKKGSQTALEFISAFSGSKLELGDGKAATLLTVEEYKAHVTKTFAGTRGKMKKLLMEEIPEGFIDRQLNDTRYISKVVKNLLSNVVREDGEQETTVARLLPVTGAITAQMKHDWGLEDVWNDLVTPRFRRLNDLSNTENFGTINPKTGKFLPTVPLDFQKGFSKKRIDHRHHAMDALTIACITREHVNYLNSLNSERKNFSLVSKLRHTELTPINGEMRSVAKAYFKPWETFTQDAKAALGKVVVSYKENLRVINKTTNYFQKRDQDNKIVQCKQLKGDKWAIRKPLHQETIFGLIKMRVRKLVTLTDAIDYVESIIETDIRDNLKLLLDRKWTKKQIIDHYKKHQYELNGRQINKIEVWHWDESNVASRKALNKKPLGPNLDSKKILTINDVTIQKILLRHLASYNTREKGEIIEHPEEAFSTDGVDTMNSNIVVLNDGVPHFSIVKVRVIEPLGNKFAVGVRGNKKKKFAITAIGTNLFFGIYLDSNGKRNYDSIPLNVVIDRQKQGLSPVPEINEVGDQLAFYLSPGDLVYVPEPNEDIRAIDFSNLSATEVNKVYKMVSCTGNQCMFIRNDISAPIVNKYEFSPLNKQEKSIEGHMIKQVCIKLKVDRLGNVKPV